MARKATGGGEQPSPLEGGVAPDKGREESEGSEQSPEHRPLLAAGWKPKVLMGKTIWERPDDGFYFSEEMALLLMDGTEDHRQRGHERGGPSLEASITRLETGGRG